MTDEGIAEEIICDYESRVEYGKKKLFISCNECERGGKKLKDPTCRTSLINILMDEYNITEVVLSAPIEKQYKEDAIDLFTDLSELTGEIRNFARRDPIKDAVEENTISEKKAKKMREKCSSCEKFPRTIFSQLEKKLKRNYSDFVESLHDILDYNPPNNPVCDQCLNQTKDDCAYLLERSLDISSMILYSAFRVVKEKDISDSEEQGRKTKALKKFYKDLNISVLDRGINSVLDSNKFIRPSFTTSWIRKKLPNKKELLDEYEVGDATIKHYYLIDEMESLYYISLEDYNISEQEAELIQLTIDELSDQYPENISLEDRAETRKYIKSRVKKIMRRIIQKEGFSLNQPEDKTGNRMNELISILAKHTAGMGVLEPLLKDKKIQDIYVDAPAPSNPVYVNPGPLVHDKMADNCWTNLILGKEDIDSMLSRFRMESGRPFSESEPVLEHNMKDFNIRSTVVGEPMSPEGVALALRRHSGEPWTLLKLIANNTLTAKAAGLFSFLIDGRSTILVAGSRGAGKTSLLGALMLEFPTTQRMLTIEDTQELPTRRMQELKYKVQNIMVGSEDDSSGTGYEKSPEEALRVSLRLGESAIVMGEVRGEEAKTLYEAMRAGTAGSSVLGTFHANSANSVFERAVYDIGISKKSFLATDIVAVMNLKRPSGRMKPVRKLSQLSELDKESETVGEFRDLMEYNDNKGEIEGTDVLDFSSQTVGRIARSWGMSLEEAMKNIDARTKYRKMIVNKAKENNLPSLLKAKWVKKTNKAFWKYLGKEQDKEGEIDYQKVLYDWEDWFLESIKYV